MANYERGSTDDVRVFDGGEDDEDVEGSRLPLLIVIALLVLAAFGAVVYLAYQRGVSQGKGEIRELAAAPGPAKIAPTNAGGTPTPYTGLKIYQQPAPSDENADATPPAKPVDTPPAMTAAPTTPKPQAAAVTPPRPAPAAAMPAPTPAKPATLPPIKPVDTTPTTTAMIPAKPVTPAKPEPAPAKPAPTQVAAATPPPVVTPTPAAEAPPAGSGFVQIGSYKSMAEANAAWTSYKAKHAGAIGGLPDHIQSADLGAKGTWYRLRIVAGSKADAAALCTKLKAEGGDCILAK